MKSMDDMVTDSSFEGIVAIKDANLNKEGKLVYGFTNRESIEISLDVLFSINLEPGQTITARVEGSSKETNSTIPRYIHYDTFSKIPKNGTIEGQLPQRIQAQGYERKFDKMSEWLKKSEEQIEINLHRIKELEISLIDRESRIELLEKCLNNDKTILKEETRKRERGEVMFKYGFLSYLIFLLISVALFFSAGSLYVLWKVTDTEIINPITLFMVSIMSLGWGCTAIAGMFSVRKRSKAL